MKSRSARREAKRLRRRYRKFGRPGTKEFTAIHSTTGERRVRRMSLGKLHSLAGLRRKRKGTLAEFVAEQGTPFKGFMAMPVQERRRMRRDRQAMLVRQGRKLAEARSIGTFGNGPKFATSIKTRRAA